MKPVDQTTFGFPGGNCFSACLASLLEIPIDEVPYFMPPDPRSLPAHGPLRFTSNGVTGPAREIRPGVYEAEMPAPVLAPARDSLARCADCGNDRWKAIGHRLCERCKERDALKVALGEALDKWEDWHDWNDETNGRTPKRELERARIAELRRLL